MISHHYLISDRLILRAPEMEDVDFLYQFENDTNLWPVSDCDMPYSRFQLENYIKTNTHNLLVDMQLRLMIVEKASSKAIGTIDLFNYEGHHQRAELGIAIAEAYRGKGYGSETLNALFRYVSELLNLHQLYVHVLTTNIQALQLFERNGFMQTGHLKDWVLFGGQFHDVVLLQKQL